MSKTTLPKEIDDDFKKTLEVWIENDEYLESIIDSLMFYIKEEKATAVSQAEERVKQQVEQKTVAELYNKFNRIIDDHEEMYQWVRIKLLVDSDNN